MEIPILTLKLNGSPKVSCSDGNGRISRLLTLLLLYKANYMVGKYISIEKIIEQTKDSYYEALEKSSIKWNN